MDKIKWIEGNFECGHCGHTWNELIMDLVDALSINEVFDLRDMLIDRCNEIKGIVI